MGHHNLCQLESIFSSLMLLLNFIICCISAVEPSKSIHNQAFIQTEKELKFMIDGVPVNFPPERFPNLRIDDGKVPASPVRFDPPYLDFKENPVGEPHLEQVTLINPDVGKTVHLLSISASTSHFHCSFFQKKMVPVGGNTTFDVVFLSREVGNVENTLFIHTSRGTYKYQVFGVGVSSPYRLQPFVGARIPVNTSFTPYIHLYNPHPFSIQITEMYTSGGDLHLELPTSSLRSAPKKMWEVPPYETRTVMRVRMVGRRPSNNTAFVKVKTNLTEPKYGFVLPIEVEVSNKPGLYSPTERLNFGILRTLDNPKSMKLVVINSSDKPIHVTSVELDKPNDAVSIDFRPMKILPGVMRHTTLAMVTFTAVKALHSSQWNGRVIVRSHSDEQTLVVPYSADVLHGSLVYDANSTKFFAGTGRENVTREILISNTFNVTIVIYSASLNADALAFFEITNFSRPVMIAPQESRAPFALRFKPGGRSVQFITRLGIFSNASLFVIPLFVYHGKLTVVPHRPELYHGHLDFGTLGVEESRSLTFTLRNENPVDVHISEMNANWDRAVIKLKGIERGNGTTLTRKHNVSQYKINPLTLRPYHYAVFTVILTAPEQEGVFASDIKMFTQFETLSIPYYVRTAQGSLSVVPETVVIEDSFPGRVSSHPLILQSTFSHAMELKSVRFQPNDVRFRYQPLQALPITMKPSVSTSVGTILFDPMRGCRADVRSDADGDGGGGSGEVAHGGGENSCYIGFNIHSQMGHQWLLSLSLDKAVVDVDQYTYTRLLQQWDTLRRDDGHVVNVTLLLDASQVRGFLSKAQAHLVWPRLLGRQTEHLEFPLTQLGNSSYRDLVLVNPADVPILVQVLPLSAYPSPSTLLELLGIVDGEVNVEDSSWSSSSSASTSSSSAGSSSSNVGGIPVNSAKNTNNNNNNNNNYKLNNHEVFRVGHPSLNRHIESVFGVEPHHQSVALILKPRTPHTVRVEFRPNDAGPVASYLLVRSNLTGLETVRVSGEGGQGRILFHNYPPQDAPPLLFELTEKHLRNCDKSSHTKGVVPSFTVRRPFTLRNPGHLPVYIHGFTFGPWPGSWCHGYGFSVLDCTSFDLGVNQSRKVDLAFTPDFSLHRVQQSVRLHTSLGEQPFNLTVQATLPAHMLTRCSQALSRPEWEVLVWYFVVIVSSFVFVCILVTAYFDADRMFTHDVITRQYLMNYPLNQPNASAVFDLKKVAAGLQTPELFTAAAAAAAAVAAANSSSGVGGVGVGGSSHLMPTGGGGGGSGAASSSPSASAAAVNSISSVLSDRWHEGLRHRGASAVGFDALEGQHLLGHQQQQQQHDANNSSGQLTSARRPELLSVCSSSTNSTNILQQQQQQQQQKKKRKKTWYHWMKNVFFTSVWHHRSALKPRLHDNATAVSVGPSTSGTAGSSTSGACSVSGFSSVGGVVNTGSIGARVSEDGTRPIIEEKSNKTCNGSSPALNSQESSGSGYLATSQQQQQQQQQQSHSKSRRQRVGNKESRASGQNAVGGSCGGVSSRWRVGASASSSSLSQAASDSVPVPDFAPIVIPADERSNRRGGGSGGAGGGGSGGGGGGGGGNSGGIGQRGRDGAGRKSRTVANTASTDDSASKSSSASVSAAFVNSSLSGNKAANEDSASSTTESSTNDDKTCRQSPDLSSVSESAGAPRGANAGVGGHRRASRSSGASPASGGGGDDGRGSPEGTSHELMGGTALGGSSGSALCQPPSLTHAGGSSASHSGGGGSGRSSHKSRNERRKPPRANVWEQQQQQQQAQQQQQQQQQLQHQQQQQSYQNSLHQAGHMQVAGQTLPFATMHSAQENSRVRDAHDLAAEVASRHLKSSRLNVAQQPNSINPGMMSNPGAMPASMAFKQPMGLTANGPPSTQGAKMAVNVGGPKRQNNSNGQSGDESADSTDETPLWDDDRFSLPPPEDMEQLSSQSEQFARDLKLSDPSISSTSFMGIPYGPGINSMTRGPSPAFVDTSWYTAHMRAQQAGQGPHGHRLACPPPGGIQLPGMPAAHMHHLQSATNAAAGPGGEGLIPTGLPRVGELQRMNMEKRSAMLEYERSRQQLQQQQHQQMFLPGRQMTPGPPPTSSAANPPVPTTTAPMDDVSWMTEPDAASPAQWANELDMQAILDPGLGASGLGTPDAMSRRQDWCTPVTRTLWTDRNTRALWEMADDSEVPPGSHQDHLAAHLIPGDLLGSDTSSPGDELRHSIWNPVSANAGGPVHPTSAPNSSTPPAPGTDFDFGPNGTPPPGLSS